MADPRITEIGGVPLLSEYADPNQLASMQGLAPPPVEPPGLQGVVGPSRATSPPAAPFTGRVPQGAIDAVTGVLRDTTARNKLGAPELPAGAQPGVAPKPGGSSISDFVKAMPPMPSGPQMGTTTETQTTFKSVPKSELKRLDKAYEDEKKATEAAAKVGQSQADAERARMEARDAHLEEMARQRAVNELVRQNRLEMADLEVRKAQAAAKKDIDPEALWKEKGTAARVVAEIGRALGAMGASLAHTENFADNIIKGSIQSNIDAQKSNRDNARQDATEKMGLLRFYQSQGLDERQAEHAARVDYIEQVQNQLSTEAAKYKSQQIQANAATLNAQLDKAKATELANLNTATVTRQVTTAPLKSGAGGTAQQLPASEASGLGEAKGAIDNLHALAKQFDEKGAGGVSGWLKNMLPFFKNDAKRYGDDAMSAAQVIGSYLEGGKLGDRDFERHLNELPQAGESEATKQNKIANLERLIGNRHKSKKEALGAAGYDVSRIPNATANVGFTPR
jgi:hypothetical protein